MNPKPSHTLYLIVVLACLSSVVRAQETYQMMESTEGEKDKAYLPTDREGSAYPPTMDNQASESSGDTSSYRALSHEVSKPIEPSSKSSEKQSETKSGNDNSVLSFNFLYYIIQKFKMSDIVDQ
jgi:hypothetical protein